MINLYWSSGNDPASDDFSIMYEEPHTLFKDKIKELQDG